MPRITRKRQRIFGVNSSQTGIFGSGLNSGGILSNDPDDIQSAAWEGGWNSATISGEKLPALNEDQGVKYVVTRQIAYLMQEGIPEWDSGTEYHQNSIVKQTGTVRLYKSIVNDNVGNLISNPSYWRFLCDLDTVQPLNNYTATDAPTTSDDSTLGYSAGSFWYDTSNEESYLCVDPSIGSAIWILQSTITPEEITASMISYNNTLSGLSSTRVQEAIDELASGSFVSKPIGEIFHIQDNLSGCPIPSNAGPAKFIRLTAGEDGSGDYNEGLLGDETIDADYEDERGHEGLSITAEILVGPMTGQRIELINSSEAFVGARTTAGVLTHDQFQGHWHQGYSGGQGASSLGSNGRVISVGTSETGPNAGMVRDPINDGVNAEPRTGTRTIPKTYSATAYMRIA